MVVNGGLSQYCFNGPTSRNVAGIYCLSDVNCNLLFWVYTLAPVSGSWAVLHRSAGAQHLVSEPVVPNPLVWESPGSASSTRVEPIGSDVPWKAQQKSGGFGCCKAERQPTRKQATMMVNEATW